MRTVVYTPFPQPTLCHALIAAVRQHGRSTTIVEDIRGKPETYGDFLRATLALGRITSRLAGPGERIGVLLPNISTTLSLIFGMGAFGRIPAMLNYTAGAEGMQNACTAAGIQVAITSRQFLAKANLTETVQAMQQVRWVYLEDFKAGFSLLDKLWLMGFALWFPERVIETSDPDAPAIVLFTSGTEGKPKGTVLSHQALLANVAQIQAVIDFSPSDTFFTALPIFHALGLTAGAIMPVITGSKLFLYASPLHYKEIPGLVKTHACNVLISTPTFLNQYAKQAKPDDFQNMRYVVAGGEKLSVEVSALWQDKYNIRLLEGYGATETAPVLAVNTPDAYQAGSVGKLLPEIEYRIVPVPGIEKGGVLHVRGPNLMSGYYLFQSPGVITPPASDAGPGWYDTGDVVEVDEAGYVRIVGRVKRFAKIAGEMVSLETVERIAATAASDHSHAATSQADAQRGECLVLFTTDATLNRERLLTAARQLGLPELAVPKKILCVDALPVLGIGKTDYVTLKKMAESV